MGKTGTKARTSGKSRKAPGTAVALRPRAELGALASLADRARDFAEAASAANTRRAWRSDWSAFTAWCASRQLLTLPAAPGTLAAYLADLAGRGLKASTIRRAFATVGKAHEAVGQPSPTKAPEVRRVLAGIVRTIGSAKTGKAALAVEDLRAIVQALPDSATGARDRALLLVGFAGALRRSELVALDLVDVKVAADGLEVTVRRSKTDSEGKGQLVGVPRGAHPETDPVRAFEQWRRAAGLRTGPLFRRIDRYGNVSTRLTDRAVALILKRAARGAGLEAEDLAGHSLRRGLITAAAKAGASERDIMRQSRHKSVEVMRAYVEAAAVLDASNVARRIGL